MPTQTVSDFEYTLVGLLAATPMSGYDLKRLFASSPLGTYSPSSGGIYPSLRRLESLGLLSAEIERTSDVRARRVYTATERGIGQLVEWLHQPVDVSAVTRNISFLLMRFALMELRSTPEQTIRFLTQMRDAMTSAIADLRPHVEAAEASGSPYRRLALYHGLATYNTHLAWTQEALSTFRTAAALAGPEGEAASESIPTPNAGG